MNAKLRFGLDSLINVLIVALVLGCQPSGCTKSGQSQEAELMAEVVKLADGLDRYLEIKGRLPASREAFQAFCIESNLPCAKLDWSRVSWQSMTDKKLVVVYNSDGYSLPITVEQNSDSPHEVGTTRQRLKENLQKLMQDGKAPDGP